MSFLYFNLDEHGKRKLRKDGARYTVNPVAMVFTNDNYYLVAYHDNHDNITNYRIDRMIEVRIELQDINQEACPKDFDVSKYRLQAFSMFPGKTTKVRFEANRDMIDPLMDKFGEDITLVCNGEDKISFQAEVQLSNVFFGWCSSFGDRLKIIAPEETVEEYKTYIQGIIEKYNQ